MPTPARRKLRAANRLALPETAICFLGPVAVTRVAQVERAFAA